MKMFSQLTFCSTVLRNKAMCFRGAVESSRMEISEVAPGCTCPTKYNVLQGSALCPGHFQVESVLGSLA